MYTCSNCGAISSSWFGKCPECSQFNTLVKNELDKKDKKSQLKPAELTSFSKIKGHASGRISTGMHEIDRVLGGGFTIGEVILLAGEPGVGKSTLLLSGLSKLKTVYISGEESAEQIRSRADRLALTIANFTYSSETDIDAVIAALKTAIKTFNVAVIDSIQTMYTQDVTATPGSVSQIREVTSRLVDFAKQYDKTVIIVGHVTKEGEIAGPKTLEHFVDRVLYLEGERVSQFRLLRASKNRFGPTDEVGVFEMRANGLHPLTNPTAFLHNGAEKAVGKAIVGVTEGSRALFFEVQSLVVPTNLPVPRRVVSGVDYNKVQLILAVIRKNLKLAMDSFDIYINVVGGVTIRSTAADLGIAAAVVSSVKNIPLSSQSVFVGEIGLLGEVRVTMGGEKIEKEAARYGFKHIYSAKKIPTMRDMSKLFQ